MKLQTIETVELSSLCNLGCKYCINRLIPGVHKRSPGIMTDRVFDRSLEILQQLVSNNTQSGVININGNGESLLDKDIVKRAEKVKLVVGYDRSVQFSTNGYRMTIDLARALKDAGVDKVDVSCHNIMLARNAVKCLKLAGLRGAINNGLVTAPHNWAEQIEEEYWVYAIQPVLCIPLIEGRGYISSEGFVSPCCYDYQIKGSIGSVFGQHLFERSFKPFALCEKCHQIVIPEILNDAVKEQIALCR